MNRGNGDLLEKLLADRTCDMTPTSARPAARVLYLPVARDSEFSSLCASVLSKTELERADRFVAMEDRAKFEQRRALRRYWGAIALGLSRSLSEITFEETATGRPYLSDATDLWFSFSSCRFGMLGAWSSTHTVGVDIEDPTRALEADELAGATLLLASGAGSFMTGTEIMVDGGYAAMTI